MKYSLKPVLVLFVVTLLAFNGILPFSQELSNDIQYISANSQSRLAKNKTKNTLDFSNDFQSLENDNTDLTKHLTDDGDLISTYVNFSLPVAGRLFKTTNVPTPIIVYFEASDRRKTGRAPPFKTFS